MKQPQAITELIMNAESKLTSERGSKDTQRSLPTSENRQSETLPAGTTAQAWQVMLKSRNREYRCSLIRRLYGTRQQLLDTFHVAKQTKITQNASLCYFGTAPTLRAADDTFGNGTVSEWLTYQIADLSEYAGCKDKVEPYQLQQLAEIIATSFYYLKITELMLFFNKFKAGNYGKFYGRFDPLTITTALQEFVENDRKTAYAHHEQEIREAWENEPIHQRYPRFSPQDLDELQYWQRFTQLLRGKEEREQKRLEAIKQQTK